MYIDYDVNQRIQQYKEEVKRVERKEDSRK